MGFDGLPSFVVDHLRRIAKQEGFDKDFEVKHESGSKAGDGFMSTLLSIKIVGRRRKESSADHPELDELALICKIQTSGSAFKENFGSHLVFRCEVFMYNVVLPALVAFQLEHRVPAEAAFGCFPKCYVASHEEGSSESVIILEDLRASGFEMWDKEKPMDFESVHLLMEQVGRLHGLSIVIRDKKPSLFQEFQDLPATFLPVFTSPGVSSMIQSTFAYAISLMDNAEDVMVLERLAKDAIRTYHDGMNVDLLGKYGVLSHGDCWMINMMFVLDKGLANSITLIDWQMSRVTSPAIDLTYFLFSSTQKPLRDAHLDDFLRIYYTNLARIIRASGSDPDVLFPEAELHRQLRQFGVYGVIMAPLTTPMVIADSSEITDLDEMAEALTKEGENTGFMANLNDGKRTLLAQQIKDVLADARRYGWI